MSKKYITTDKHPELKEGLILEWWATVSEYRAGPSNFYRCKEHQKNGLLENGYIKEVEEKEFTKTDLLYFASAMKGDYVSREEVDKFFNKDREK